MRGIKIQTEPFKVCRVQKNISTKEQEAETQTSLTFRQPVPVHFVPQNVGVDNCSQIEKGELFDFDTEVEPILQVLVGRTLELSVLEIAEEDELERLHLRRLSFEEKRDSVHEAISQLEAEVLRGEKEKHRRVVQEELKSELESIAINKSACIAFSKDFWSLDPLIKDLSLSGAFKDPQLVYLESVLLPSLIKESIRDFRIQDAFIVKEFPNVA